MVNDKSQIKAQTIRLAGVIKESIVDGPGIRFVIFSQGCPHRCKGCHNPETFDENGGYVSEITNLLSAIDKNPLLKGVTFSGGEPLLQPEACFTIAEEVKKRGLDIVLFSGYTYEQIMDMAETSLAITKLMRLVDILIDGKFELKHKDLMLTFRGSHNQRVIDVQASLQSGEIKQLDFDS